MIRVEKMDGSEASYRVRAAIVSLDASAVPEYVRLTNGAEEKEWPAGEIKNLFAEPDDATFRLEVHRPLTQVPELRPEVTQLYFNHRHRWMNALHGGQIIYDHRW